MPQLIKTPEDIFRETGSNLYSLRFCKDEKDKQAATREITEWIAQNLPGTRVEPLGPSEYSGIITGYEGELWVDFSAEGLAKFCERWERHNGESVDERFQCYLRPYQDWFEKHGHFVPTREKPIGLGLILCINTPIGIIHHRIDEAEARQSEWSRHPASVGDLWMHAVRLWPELVPVDLYTLDFGLISPVYQHEEPETWLATINPYPLQPVEDRQQTERDVHAWFGLPDHVKLISDM